MHTLTLCLLVCSQGCGLRTYVIATDCCFSLECGGSCQSAFTCVDGAYLHMASCKVDFKLSDGSQPCNVTAVQISGQNCSSYPAWCNMSNCRFTLAPEASTDRKVQGNAVQMDSHSLLEATSCIFSGFGCRIQSPNPQSPASGKPVMHLTACTICGGFKSVACTPNRRVTCFHLLAAQSLQVYIGRDAAAVR